MRSFGSLAFRQLRARRLRSLLTTAGIVLGVAMILGVLLLTVTIHRTFNDLFDSVYGRTDLVVSGIGGDAVRHSALDEVKAHTRSRPGGGSGAQRLHPRRSLRGGLDRRRPAAERRRSERQGRGALRREHRRGAQTTARAGDRPAAKLGRGQRDRARRPRAPGDPHRRQATACGGPVPVRERTGLRRAGLRHDAGRLGAPGDGQAARLGRGGPGGRRRRGDDRPRQGRPSSPSASGGRGPDARPKERRRRGAAPGLQRDPLLLRRDGPVRRRLSDLQLLQHDRLPADAGDRHAPGPGGGALEDHRLGAPRGRPAGRLWAQPSGWAWASCWRSD